MPIKIGRIAAKVPMKKFPSQFADLLSRRGRSILNRGCLDTGQAFHDGTTPLALFTGVLDPKMASACRDLLDRTLYRHVRRVDSPIPPEAMNGMRKNYAERLPKTLRFKTAYFASRTSQAYKAASGIGLFDMMRSETLALFAEAVTSLSLVRNPGVQAILYEPGDYAGPHNDHHPEDAHLRHGYVDLHISLTNSGVSSQYLICEKSGHFSSMYSVSKNGSVAVYRLPFWHYTTPLIGKARTQKPARRWLLLASFELAAPAKTARNK